MKKYIPYGLILILLFIVIWQCAERRNNKVDDVLSKVEAVKRPMQKKIDSLSSAIAQLKKDSILISEEKTATNKKYKELLSKKLAPSLADSLRAKEIEKGIATFGPPLTPQHQQVLAAIYGNQAFDNLFLTQDLLNNQVKVSTAYKGIVKAQQPIIQAQDVAINKLAKMSKKGFWAKLWGWILIGGAFVLGLAL